MLTLMEVDGNQGCVDCLLSEEEEKWMPSIVTLKNEVIGNNRQKSLVITRGVIPRLLEWVINGDCNIELRTEAATVLGSLAKGTEENILQLMESGCVTVLLKGLSNSNLKFMEACLRCLRTIFVSSQLPIHHVYEDATVAPHLVNILSKSVCTQECIATILAHCCKTAEHQSILCANGAIIALAPLLASNVYKVQMPTMKCFAVLCFENEEASRMVVSASYNGDSIPCLLGRLLSRDKTSEMQMSAAKCLTYLYRAGAMDSSEPLILMKTLPTLIRMCKKDRTLEENVEGAETLAYLIEVDAELQDIASISDHIIKTLAEYIRYTDVQQITTRLSQKLGRSVNWSHELKQAAFKAFASLGANSEEIRKKIIETDNLMEHIIAGMECGDVKVKSAAVRCLHSLSRSVQQLRTTFKDHMVWKPLMTILQDCPESLLSVATSTMCNLLLEFSPGKEDLTQAGAISILVSLTGRVEPELRLNGIWGLMNMAFKAEYKVKTQIIEALGIDQVFKLLSDPDPNILMKTLGLIRNLLSTKSHIDSIMSNYGNKIMRAVVFMLESDNHAAIKEQTLCILTNVADGDQAREYIMQNEDVLGKLLTYMTQNNSNLQTAATACVYNLVRSEEEGSVARQQRLKDLGVINILKELMNCPESALFERVRICLSQFTN